jgi:hypothetical protein
MSSDSKRIDNRRMAGRIEKYIDGIAEVNKYPDL